MGVVNMFPICQVTKHNLKLRHRQKNLTAICRLKKSKQLD